jgi:2-methylcitrate dehydratase PrpD
MRPASFLFASPMEKIKYSSPPTNTPLVAQFIRELDWKEIPEDVKHTAERCILDLCAALIAGSATQLSRAVSTVSVTSYGGDQATLLFDGRRVSAAGAALANGMTIDAMDVHDGYRPAKGHAGAGVFPAAVAMGEIAGWNGGDLLSALVVGYEVALRAATALHQTACDYHTSGSWSALGAAAVAARALGLTPSQTRHALGIAEYHGPRSQMMRCIDHPTMVKDGSGWGSMVGVTASQLASHGFTGAPALTVEDKQVRSVWNDLGTRWLMRDLYFKPYACCRWAQPAIEASLQLKSRYQINPSQIKKGIVFTFEEATHLTISRPANTEQAQYSLPYPVAAALLTGRLDPQQVMPPSIFDESILQLADSVSILADKALQDRFPQEALARVVLELINGRTYESGVHAARGDPKNPLSDKELLDKFNRIAGGHLSIGRLKSLQETCWNAAKLENVKELVALLSSPLDIEPNG